MRKLRTYSAKLIAINANYTFKMVKVIAVTRHPAMPNAAAKKGDTGKNELGRLTISCTKNINSGIYEFAL